MFTRCNWACGYDCELKVNMLMCVLQEEMNGLAANIGCQTFQMFITVNWVLGRGDLSDCGFSCCTLWCHWCISMSVNCDEPWLVRDGQILASPALQPVSGSVSNLCWVVFARFSVKVFFLEGFWKVFWGVHWIRVCFPTWRKQHPLRYAQMFWTCEFVVFDVQRASTWCWKRWF